MAFRPSGSGISDSPRQASIWALVSSVRVMGTPSQSPVRAACTSLDCVAWACSLGASTCFLISSMSWAEISMYSDLYFNRPSACAASSRNSWGEICSSPRATCQSKSSRSPAENIPKLMLPCSRILALGLLMCKSFSGISVRIPIISSFLRQSCKNWSNFAPCMTTGVSPRLSR